MAFLKPFGVQGHPEIVVPQDLDQRCAASPENVQIPLMRILLEAFLNLQRQASRATSHVGMA